MIVLDTNVISEVVKPAPAAEVISWLNEQGNQEHQGLRGVRHRPHQPVLGAVSSMARNDR
jgi:hypothetical protein